MRSCLIATGLAREQGLAEEEVADCFYTALLMQWLTEMWPEARRGSDAVAVKAAITDASAQATDADREPEAPPPVLK